MDSLAGPVACNVVRTGIYFVPRAGSPDSRCIQFREFASGEVSTLLINFSTRSGRFEASPDGEWVLMGQIREQESDLMLVENFR